LAALEPRQSSAATLEALGERVDAIAAALEGILVILSVDEVTEEDRRAAFRAVISLAKRDRLIASMEEVTAEAAADTHTAEMRRLLARAKGIAP
jgi:hypothetical protein